MDNPWERIQAVIDHYGFRSVNAFAKHIGLKRAENLYQVKRGNNGLSFRLAATICRYFPEISLGWLQTGEGRMMLDSYAEFWFCSATSFDSRSRGAFLRRNSEHAHHE